MIIHIMQLAEPSHLTGSIFTKDAPHLVARRQSGLKQ